jgi:hypothetical protein
MLTKEELPGAWEEVHKLFDEADSESDFLLGWKRVYFERDDVKLVAFVGNEEDGDYCGAEVRDTITLTSGEDSAALIDWERGEDLWNFDAKHYLDEIALVALNLLRAVIGWSEEEVYDYLIVHKDEIVASAVAAARSG